MFKRKIDAIKKIIPLTIIKAKLLLEKYDSNSSFHLYIQIHLNSKINTGNVDTFFFKEINKNVRSIFNFYNYILKYNRPYSKEFILNKYFNVKKLIGVQKIHLSLPLYINNVTGVTDSASSMLFEKKVTIIMTVFNEEELVKYALESLFRQTYKNLNVIVVDDASTDSTPQKLLEAKKYYSNQLKIITLKENYGTYVAKNIAISYADGDLITFQDADDWSHPERILEHVKMHINTQVKFTISKLIRITKEGYFFSRHMYPLDRLSMVSLMIDKKLIKEIGYFRKQRIGSDSEYFERLKKFTEYEYVRIDKVLMLCAHKDNSLTTSIVTGVEGFKRKHHWEKWNEWHRLLKKLKKKPFVSFCNKNYR